MNCLSCQTQLGPGQRFCTRCGATTAPGGGRSATATLPPLASLRCESCSHWLPSPTGKCAPCSSGVLARATSAATRTRVRIWPLVVFPALFVMGLLGKPLFSHSFPLLVLFGVMAFLAFRMRRALAEFLRRVTSIPPFGLWWAVQRHVPRPLLWLAGIGVPLVLGFVMTEPLSDLFDGYGFPIAVVSISVNTVVAFLLLARAPGGGS